MSTVLRATLKAKLAPYMLAIKLSILATIFLGGLVTGCKIQADSNAAELGAKAHDLMVCQLDRRSLSDALNEVNAKAEQAKRDAAAQAAYAVEAVRQADKARAAYEREIAGIGQELAKAKRTPTCRTQLEAPLCAPLLH